MAWFAWLMLIYFWLFAFLVVASIGKEREPPSPKVAAWVVVVVGLLSWGLISSYLNG